VEELMEDADGGGYRVEFTRNPNHQIHD
jgi:hypothetical protein